MEATAHTKFLRMSPRKIRRVLNLIKGKSVTEALDILHFSGKRAAEPLIKTIHSAFSNYGNYEDMDRIDESQAYIKKAYVNSGPTLKRIRPRAMGRAALIRKRTSHITIVLDEI
ncbi:MAG: 50S ribosomal protein L22 [Caldithrix sp.]|nr:50S ribosomal protein L22 [Caldithrix sp.]